MLRFEAGMRGHRDGWRHEPEQLWKASPVV